LCGGLRRTARAVITTESYYRYAVKEDRGEVHWADAAVVLLNKPIPGSHAKPYAFQNAGCSGSTTVTVAGYPSMLAGRCHFDGAKQWKSHGNLSCRQLQNGLYASSVDSCAGGSGSRVVDATGRVVGIFVAEQMNARGGCSYNLVVRILDGHHEKRQPLGVYMRTLLRRLRTPKARVALASD